ncbi:MAG: ribosome silencing factor [Chitinophagales bacterium]
MRRLLFLRRRYLTWGIGDIYLFSQKNLKSIKAPKVKKKAPVRKKLASTDVADANEVKKRAPRRKKKLQSNIGVIILAIQEKKGENIVSIDLRNIADAVCNYFIVCDATSTTQVKAIAENIMQQTEEVLREKPWHHEGTRIAEWILLDYVDVVVHVFLTPHRKFYQLEELWSDGVIEEHND